MTRQQKNIFFTLCFIFCFALASHARAATITLIPEKRSVAVGDSVTIDVRIDTEGENINAAQATIQFPSALVEITQIDRAGSIFGFWVEEPAFSNETGTVTFLAGAAKGVSGKSLHVLRLVGKARSVGSPEIIVSDAVITASDGKGTNILSAVESGAFSILPNTTVVTPPAAREIIPETTLLQQPQRVTRSVIPAKNLPALPTISVPLYPDESRWYNHTGEAIALWGVPDDITQVAIKMDQNPNTVPTVAEKELVDGKILGPITEGVWYIHVRFKNNVGWGNTAHYALSIDTTPPLPFEATIDNAATDNPSPSLTFNAYDALSGVSHAVIWVDGKEMLRTSSTLATLPRQELGTHTLLVRVFDRAGNSTEDDLRFEILPLPTPTIAFLSRSVSAEEFIFVSGKSIPNAIVEVRVFNRSLQEVFAGAVQSDAFGNWSLTIDKVLHPGAYMLSARAVDERGAMSRSTEDEKFQVRPKTIVSVMGLFDLGWFEIFIISLFAAASVAGIALWQHAKKERTREAYRVIAGRDVQNLVALFHENVENLDHILKNQGKKLTPNVQADANAYMKKLQDTIARMKKFIGERNI